MQNQKDRGVIPRVVRNTSYLARPVPRLGRDTTQTVGSVSVLALPKLDTAPKKSTVDHPANPAIQSKPSVVEKTNPLVAEPVYRLESGTELSDPYEMLDRLVAESTQLQDSPMSFSENDLSDAASQISAKDKLASIPEMPAAAQPKRLGETKFEKTTDQPPVAKETVDSTKAKAISPSRDTGEDATDLSVLDQIPIFDKISDEADDILVFEDDLEGSEVERSSKKRQKSIKTKTSVADKIRRSRKKRAQPVANKYYRKTTKQKKTNIGAKHLVVVSMIGILVAGGVAFSQTKTVLPDDMSAQQSAVLSATTLGQPKTETPSSTKPSSGDLASYRVSASLPKVIRISSINTEARVTRVALNDQGILKTPDNIYDTGWYQDSARAGEPGVMVLTGMYSGDGVFSQLRQLKLDDSIEIEKGDGQKLRYGVRKIEQDVVDFTPESILNPPDGSSPWLALVTCRDTGSMTCGTSGRTVVMARQM